MGEAYLFGTGGSSGGNLSNAFAIIYVIYPTGSVCTCSNGVKTLKAGSKSGAWAFGVPSGGNWVVSITDGTKTSSRTVSNVEQNKTYKLDISYELWLYKDGHVYPDTTGDWTLYSRFGGTDGNGKEIVRYDTYIDTTCRANGWGGDNYGTFYTNNVIDVTNYTELIINPEWSTNITSNTTIRFGLVRPSDTLRTNNPTFVASLKSPNTSILDITELTGEYRVAFHVYVSWTNPSLGNDGRITSVYLR